MATRAVKVAQWVKTLATKPATHLVEGEKQLPQGIP